MKKIAFSPIALLSLTVALAAFLIGCGQSVEPDADTSVANTSATENDDPSQGGWWCVEHGIPEEECSMCSTKAADAAKAKGDWCNEHNRAESQCFKCDSSRAEKFANLYEAKFGTKPPEVTEQPK